GGTISQNMLTNGGLGGAICLMSYTVTSSLGVTTVTPSYFTVSGSASIPYPDGSKNDVYLYNGCFITVSGDLSQTSVASVTLDDGPSRGRTILSAGTGVTITEAIANKFSLTNADDGWEIRAASGGASAYITSPVYVASSAETDSTRKICNPAPESGNDGSKSKPYPSINNALTAFTDPSAPAEIIVDGTVLGQQSISGASFQASSLIVTGYKAAGENSSEAVLKYIYNGTDTAGGRPLSINTTVPVTVKHLKITGGYVIGNGGGIFVDGESSLCLAAGSVVAGNTAITTDSYHADGNGHGGGVYVKQNASLFVCENALIGDSATSTTLPNYDTVGINKAYSGGGIYSYGSLYIGYSGMNSGSPVLSPISEGYGIRRNYAENSGGGIYVTKTCKIASGNISYNKAEQFGGGAEFGGYQTSHEISGGVIEGNYASDGGGIQISLDSTVTISGGRIGGEGAPNTASSEGGAVRVVGTFKVKDSAYIPYGGSEKSNDVYLCSEKTITVAGDLSQTSVASVTLDDGPSRGRTILSAGTGVTITDDIVSKFSLANVDDSWEKKIPSDGSKMYITSPVYVASGGVDGTRIYCDAAPESGNNGSRSKPYASIADALRSFASGATEAEIIIDGNILDTGSSPQKISDSSLPSSITIKGYIKPSETSSQAALNGGLNGNRALLVNLGNATDSLTIKDLTITGGTGQTYGGGIFLQKGVLTLSDGVKV
ncbi:MAG: hypothetical protein K5917_01675, partial [Clostridiales bacterium]|nr:hypothetical protein [Clostridiales bacterium]